MNCSIILLNINNKETQKISSFFNTSNIHSCNNKKSLLKLCIKLHIDVLCYMDLDSIYSLASIETCLEQFTTTNVDMICLLSNEIICIPSKILKTAFVSNSDNIIKDKLNNHLDSINYNPFLPFAFMCKPYIFAKFINHIKFNDSNWYLLRNTIIKQMLISKGTISLLYPVVQIKTRQIKSKFSINTDRNRLHTEIQKLSTDFIENDIPIDNFSVYDGRMGMAYFYFISSYYTNNKELYNRGIKILFDYNEYINHTFISNYLDEIISIASALNFLTQYSLIKINCTFLDNLDNIICRYMNYYKTKKNSFEIGIAEIGRYFIGRIHNPKVSEKQKIKIESHLHVLIDEMFHSFVLFRFNKFCKSEKIDIMIFLIMNDKIGVNRLLSKKMLKALSDNISITEMSKYQLIRYYNSMNNISQITKIAQSMRKLNNNQSILRGGKLEYYLWKLSLLYGFDVKWWQIY